MLIYVVNTSQNIKSTEFNKVIRAIKKQVKYDWTPSWSMPATIKSKKIDNLGVQAPELNVADVIL